jgi:hypothetical protein
VHHLCRDPIVSHPILSGLITVIFIILCLHWSTSILILHTSLLPPLVDFNLIIGLQEESMREDCRPDSVPALHGHESLEGSCQCCSRTRQEDGVRVRRSVPILNTLYCRLVLLRTFCTCLDIAFSHLVHMIVNNSIHRSIFPVTDSRIYL